MKLSSLLSRIRIDIADRDKDRFEDAILIDYVNEALDEIFKLYPSIFKKTVVYRLQEGDVQQPCCCDKLISVEALTDANGVKVGELRKTDTSATISFGKNNCAKKDSVPSEYSLDKETPSFTVTPPVKPGQEFYARITCAVKPCEIPFDLETELPWYVSDRYASIIDYVIYRALGTEHESQTSRAISESRKRDFLESLGYSIKSDKRLTEAK